MEDDAEDVVDPAVAAAPPSIVCTHRATFDDAAVDAATDVEGEPGDAAAAAAAVDGGAVTPVMTAMAAEATVVEGQCAATAVMFCSTKRRMVKPDMDGWIGEPELLQLKKK